MDSSRIFSDLPQPSRADRWQPLRSGVLNLYRYDYEEFHFEDGRLLLRGNNGSGKSRVLALQLPFLLDGEVSPSRVEPDGDSAKRIEWNLLMGRHPDRTGYTWIEFARRDADGSTRFLTLGCGMRAVAGQSGLHSRWFFTTTQRVGQDFFLQTPLRQPLGRDRLQEAIGAAGRVFTKAEDYRRAVDDALFGLGPRFGPLLELLLRLRRPQLTRKLDEEELSGALSDALPTLPAQMIDEVAESFRSLEADRETLRDFTEARDAVDTFLREYAVYVRIAVRRRAAAVRSTHSAYEAAQRDAREAEARFNLAAGQLATLADLRAGLDTQLAGAEAAERTLRESPEMRTAEEVKLASDTSAAAALAAEIAATDEQKAAAAEALAHRRQQEASEHTERIAAELTKQLHLAEAGAAAADLAEAHREHVPPAPVSGWQEAPNVTRGETALRRTLTQRDRALQVLREHEKAVAAAEAAFAAADAGRRRAEEAASEARDAEHSAREALAVQGTHLVESYGVWRSAVRQFVPPHADTVADEFAAWLEQREGPSPLRRAIEAAHGAALTSLAAREAVLERTMSELDASIHELDTAIERLERGETAPPPPPPARRAERTGRAGAPLWRVCDFRADVPENSRANIEAALQAAGLLDAWVLPDGTLLDAAEDTFLLDAADVAPPATRHLGQILAPAIDADDPAAGMLTAALLERLLARIGYGRAEGAHWIAGDGAWQLGPLSGRWSKPAAEYLGESTRAAARRRRIAELRMRREESDTLRRNARENLVLVARDRADAAAELARAPVDEPVLRAGYALEAATRAVAETLAASERASREAAARRATRDEHAQQRDRDAADLKLAAWLGRLDDLSRATQAYANALAGLWPTVRHWATVAAQFAALREHAETAEAEHRARRTRREHAEAAAEAARLRYETLRATHGAEISVVLARLAAAETDVKRFKSALSENQIQQLRQTEAHTQARNDRAGAEQQRDAHEQQRAAAIGSLQQFAEQRLLAEADPQLRDVEPAGWAVSHAVELARKIEPLLADAPDGDDAWRRRQDAIHAHIQELRDQLITHGHQPETHQVEDLVLVRCLFQARPHTMTELRDAFAGELEQREQLLEAKEREIIENHLLAEVAVELQKLIRAAETWRASANDELLSRPTSTGVRFRFQWEPDMESRFHEVRPALLRKGELWTPAQRTALAEFLQERIRAEQTADESGSWRDHLAKALDYRRWHRFVVERQQEGQWRRLDKRTYGTGSGGEKALALTLPRFAAAAAHYRSARADAPRLVMLDEAFAGIDPTMRAQCMGVLTQFDLDVIMTSEQEWGCYATVPALAIYHLTTLPGIDAVAATRWIWNGRERRQIDTPLPPVALPGDSANGTESLLGVTGE